LKNRNSAFNSLFKVAEAQQGYFTASQAITAGYPDNTHPYHVQSGHWIREFRGIYRLAHFPVTEYPDLVRWFLWSRNREGRPQGVYSHETALSLHGLSDVMPSKIHMIVPPNFRRNGKIPDVLILHAQQIPPSDVVDMPGFKATRVLRAVTDTIQMGAISDEFLKQALRQGLKRGLITQSEIKKVKKLAPTTKETLEKLIKQL
jgi:predicted transcriptional regulator of viral defense system